MKIRTDLNNTLIKSSLALLLLIALSSFTQSPVKMQAFMVAIKNTENGLELKGLKGNAWTNLSFSINNDKPQAIDDAGMSEVEGSTSSDKKLAGFLFTITKTKNGIMLKGIKGTAWKELSFTLSKGQSQKIDQMGMID